MLETRDGLHRLIEDSLGPERARLNGHPDSRLPNTLSIGFRDVRADELTRELSDSLAVSAGAACHGDGVSISPVLEAMNVPGRWAAGTLRFSTGRETTMEDVARAAELVTGAVRNIDEERRG
jgi:cysteine desulfurase